MGKNTRSDRLASVASFSIVVDWRRNLSLHFMSAGTSTFIACKRTVLVSTFRFYKGWDCTLYFDFLAWFDSSTVWSNAVTVMSIPNFWNKNGRMDLLGAVVFTLYATGVSVTFRTFKYRATCCVKGPTADNIRICGA